MIQQRGCSRARLLWDCSTLAAVAQWKSSMWEHLTLFKNDKDKHIQSSSAEYRSLNMWLITINGGFVAGPKSQAGNSEATFNEMQFTFHLSSRKPHTHARTHSKSVYHKRVKLKPLREQADLWGGAVNWICIGSFLMPSKHWNPSYSDSWVDHCRMQKLK